MTGQRPIRASDRDRECVVEVLKDAFAAGCLDSGELEQRSGEAYRARTLDELHDLTADLPGWLLDRPAALPREYRQGRPQRPLARAWSPGFVLAIAGFWLTAVAMAWAPLASIPLILVWLLVMVSPRRPRD